MFERRSNLAGFTTSLQDTILTAVAFVLAYWFRDRILTQLVGPGVVQPALYPWRDYWPILTLTLAVWFVGGHILGIYRDVQLRDGWSTAGDIFKLVALGLVSLNALLYLFRADFVSRAFVLTVGVVDFALLIAGRWTLASSRSWLRGKLRRQTYCLIVGTGQAAQEAGALIEESEALGLRLLGFVATGAPPLAPGEGIAARYPVFTLPNAFEILRNQVVDDLIVTVGKSDLEQLEPLINCCHELGIRTRLALGFLPRTFQHVHMENLGDIPLLTLGSAPNDELALFAKRSADTFLAATALVLLSPLMLVLAILVWLTSPGPVLYRQTRCGLNGRRFTLYKFRSMVANAETLRTELEPLNEMSGAAFKMANDPRCTKLGRKIRKYGLDELPQLWNVLLGDMSFVGPRPPLPQEVEKYKPWQRRRLRMRPGLTCLWTVEGRSRKNFDHLAQFDLAYIDNWSLWLDLKIFLRTIPRVASGRGAS